MEIHSSSLALAPAKIKQNDLQSKQNIKKEPQTNQETRLPSVYIDDSKVPHLQKISKEINQHQNTILTAQQSRAVNAYLQEKTQDLKIQRSELITGIDYFA